MLCKYLRAAMREANYELLEEGGCYGSIPGFEGVWADGLSLEECRDELEEVLEEWLLFRRILACKDRLFWAVID